jgi:hypothetical protein
VKYPSLGIAIADGFVQSLSLVLAGPGVAIFVSINLRDDSSFVAARLLGRRGPAESASLFLLFRMILELISQGSTVTSYSLEFDRITGPCLVAMTIGGWRHSVGKASIAERFECNPTDAVVGASPLPITWDGGVAVYDFEILVSTTASARPKTVVRRREKQEKR